MAIPGCRQDLECAGTLLVLSVAATALSGYQWCSVDQGGCRLVGFVLNLISTGFDKNKKM